MPSIAVSIFIDHQEVIQYPIGYIYQNLCWADEVWIHCGDDVTARLVSEACGELRPGTRIEVMHMKIAQPGDIAACRNASLRMLRQLSRCDWYVFLSADTLPTDAAAREIVAHAEANAWQRPVNIPTHMLVMYVDVGSSSWGCTLLPSGFAGEWAEDGSYFKEDDRDISPPLCLHLGYLGTDAVGRHMIQHAKTWNSPAGAARAQLYLTDRAAFVRDTLLDIREKRSTSGAHPSWLISGLWFVDEPEFWRRERFHPQCTYAGVAEHLAAEYRRAVAALGVQDDMLFVKGIADGIGRERAG